MGKMRKAGEIREMKKIKQIRVFKKIAFMSIVMLGVAGLSGCVGMRSDFDCDVSSGGRCAPMHHINKMADHGTFQDRHSSNLIGQKNLNGKEYGYLASSLDGSAIRSGESVQQIWIGPYEDKNGNYHEPAYVYAVVKQGKWIGEPMNVIQD